MQSKSMRGMTMADLTHLCVSSCLLVCLLLAPPTQGQEKCSLQIASFTNIPTFMVNGEEKPLVIHKIVVQPFTDENVNDTECVIEISELMKDEVNYTGYRLRAYLFACIKPMRIVLNGTHTPYPEIISYAQLQECEMGVESLNIISNVTTLTVLNVVGKSTLTASNDSSDCSSLDEVGTLLISNQRYPSLDMEVFYACKDHLSFMAEMILSNLSLSSLPPNLDKYMPTLQGLDLTRNNFTTPPVFPWDNSTRNLPQNLSRTVFLQTHYTFGTVTIPNYEYRREYRLDDNPHLNLTGYTFRGYLQILSIARCGLRTLRPNEFYEVEGLQLLSLDGNMLTEIPNGLFLRSSDLRKLELQRNKLSDLTTGVFKGLQYLTRLNLAENELTTLRDGLFDGMFELEKLDLHGNKITTISRGAFSELLLKLKVVNLENNPLTYLPEGLLMLRGLYDIRLQGNNITDLSFTRLDRELQFDKFKYTVVDSVSTANPDLDIPTDGLRKVDMSGSPITTISLIPGEEKYAPVKLALLMKHYKFMLTDTNILCDCNILNFTTYVREVVNNGTLGSSTIKLTLRGDEYPFEHWKCAKPTELAGRKLLHLRDEETYCRYDTMDCPNNCTCYKRSVVGTNIVDCRGVGLTEAPDILPEGDTELWLQDNHISEFKIGKHVSRQLVELHLERNGLEKLNPRCLSHMGKLKRLYIDNNLLAYIPSEIQSMHLDVVKLGGNPLQCDCHSLWMKKWLLRNFDIVEDYFEVKCVNIVEDTGTNILKVNDEDFICEKVPISKIAIPTAIPTGIVLIMLIVALLLFMFWNDFKVFLFVHTGIHPFDKKDPEGMMCYDAFIAYPPCISDWVHENILLHLQQDSKYRLYDVATDFKFGHSLQDNIQHGVQHSRRMVLVLSEDSRTDSLMQLAIEAGLEKCREEKANFLVPVLCNILPKDIDNEQLQKFFKAKKFISNTNAHFTKKLFYHMPTVPMNSQNAEKTCTKGKENKVFVDLTDTRIPIEDAGQLQPAPLPQPDLVEGATQGSTVFVWYADADFQFMMDAIVNPFEAEGHRFILSDKSFIPGASIQENILHAIEDSDRTIIILSKESLVDEWTLYAFRFATERQMLEKCFLTGLVVREGLMDSPCDEEIVKHLLAYQPLSEKDGDFHSKMRTFVQSSLKKSSRNESLEQLNTENSKL